MLAYNVIIVFGLTLSKSVTVTCYMTIHSMYVL